jgi:hypothetical protein
MVPIAGRKWVGRNHRPPRRHSPYINGFTAAGKMTGHDEMTTYANVAREGPKGLGGWLILPMLGTLVSPFVLLFDLSDTLQIIEGNPPLQNREADLLLKFGIMAYVVMMLGWIIAIVLMFQHKRAFPKLYIGLVMTALLVAVVVAYFGEELGMSLNKRMVALIRPLANLAIWGTYLLVSKRVRNTFTQ